MLYFPITYYQYFSSLCFHQFFIKWSKNLWICTIVLFDVVCQSFLNVHRLFNIPLALSLKYYFLNICLVQICDKLFTKLNSNYHKFFFWRNVDNRAEIECFPSSLFLFSMRHHFPASLQGEFLFHTKTLLSNNLAP